MSKLSKWTDMFSLTAQVKSKLRLWMEYALLALVLILLGWAAWGYTARMALKAEVAALDAKVAGTKADLKLAEARVKAVEEVNAQQAEAIDTIRGIREVDGTILAGMARDMEALRVRDDSMKVRLNTLEKSNEAVRKYLNTAVPAPVGCVLDRTCGADGDGGAGATSPANDAGKAGAARTKQDQR